MSDYDNWKNGLTDMFDSAREENDPGATREQLEEAEHKDLSMELFGKPQSELDDWEYQELMQQLDMLDEGLS